VTRKGPGMAVTVLLSLALSACAPSGSRKVTVVEVRSNGIVCLYDQYFGGRRCTTRSAFDSIGGVSVGDCLNVVMMLESDRVTEVERAKDCPPPTPSFTTGTIPSGRE